jgi:hypothetical protein
VIRQPSIDVRTGAARAAAANIFVHCFPMVLADVVRNAHPRAPHQLQLIAPGDDEALAPGLAEDDVRVVLTSAWVDLSDEPVVLRLPHTHGRHITLTLIDTAGEAFASFGSRTGHDTGLDLALVGPRWRGELPQGLKAKRAPSESIWVVSRIHAHSAFDRPDAVDVARRQGLTPLRPDPVRPLLDMAMLERSADCLRQVEEMAPAVFFQRLPVVLEGAPKTEHQLVRLQVTALQSQLSGPPAPSEWSADFSHAMARGFADGIAAIRTAAEASQGEGLGWRAATGGLRDETNALARAARAYSGLGAPLREDLLTLVCDHDEFGLPLTGEHSYRLRFDRRFTPPVQAFWWLFVRPVSSFGRRYGLGSRSELALKPDGSLDLYIQHDPPEPAYLPNWLRTPDGRFSLIMRLYCPRPEAFGVWRMPPLTRVDTAPDLLVDDQVHTLFPHLRVSFGRRSQIGR